MNDKEMRADDGGSDEHKEGGNGEDKERRNNQDEERRNDRDEGNNKPNGPIDNDASESTAPRVNQRHREPIDKTAGESQSPSVSWETQESTRVELPGSARFFSFLQAIFHVHNIKGGQVPPLIIYIFITQIYKYVRVSVAAKHKAIYLR